MISVGVGSFTDPSDSLIRSEYAVIEDIRNLTLFRGQKGESTSLHKEDL